MIWSAPWARMHWSTSCCPCPSASPPIRTWSDWSPTPKMESSIPARPSQWWTRTRPCLLPCGTRTSKAFCSPRGRCVNLTRSALRCEPYPTAPTEESSTRPPSSSTLPSQPIPTESTLLHPAHERERELCRFCTGMSEERVFLRDCICRSV